jgi:hypothetical protein
MSDIPPGDPPIVSLQEHADRADRREIAAIEEGIDRADHSRFLVNLANIREEILAPVFGPANLAAGALHLTLRDIGQARLPEVYRNAVAALRECSRIDACADWANRAEAIASYARQAKDNELRAMADRIQARAIRRCGELLAEIKAARGRRTDLELREGTLPRLTRSEAATDAGLSEHQRKTALRVASLPEKEFDAAIEAPAPTTVTALAERGKRPAAPRNAVVNDEIHVIVPVVYGPPGSKSIDEISTERQVALLMAAWRRASPDARRRFLQNIGVTIPN